jgi:tRNA G18 (ribose-2'-O)-methylase SpoU
LARLIPIDDPDDPRVAVYRQVRERDLVGRQGGFIAEGEVVLRVLLAGGGPHRAASLLVDGKRLAKLSPLIETLPEAIPVHVAGQAVLNEIVGFHIHRGILAHGLRAPDPGAAALLATLGEGALVLVLHGIANHDNMGGLFRNAGVFGVDAVLLDATSCDPLYRKAIRVSVGAALKIPFARFAPGEDVLALLESAGVEALALSPGGAAPLADLVRPARAALLLGAEGSGLPTDMLARARTFHIPMALGWDSLNVASAAAIALHELTRLGTGSEPR